MWILKNRYAWLIGTMALLVYASQHYTIGGWEHLRLVPKQSGSDRASAETNLRDSSAWEPTLRSLSVADAPSPHSTEALRTRSSTLEPRDSGPKGGGNPPTRWVSAPAMAGTMLPTNATKPTLRIATFNLQSFGETKASKEAVMEIVARILRHFDVVALQDVTARQRDTLPRLVDRINQADRRFDYCIGPRVGSGLTSMHFAFVYDTDRIEADRHQLYTVEDPMDQLEYEPLVGWFRSKLVSEEEAFTFSLVNLRISPQRAEREIALLPDLIRTIHRDGRSEDDIILAGDFGCGDSAMTQLKRLGMNFAVEGVSTTIAGDEMLDNILFSQRTTTEFLGRSGTIDFLRQFNLTPDQAFQVSNHMPVWCEFSPREGGEPGYVP